MESEELKPFLDQLVRVDLRGGQSLQGRFQDSILPGHFEVQAASGSHYPMLRSDILHIELIHPAEERAMEKQCTCSDDDPFAWTSCPLHRFEGQ